MDGGEVLEQVAFACSRCSHSAELHMHGTALACSFCALSHLAHAAGLGCGLYTVRTVPRSGASCRLSGCDCSGYVGGRDSHELFGGGGRQ